MLKHIGILEKHFLDDIELKTVKALTDAGFTLIETEGKSGTSTYIIAGDKDEDATKNEN